MVSLKHKVTLRRKVAGPETPISPSPHSAKKSNNAKIIGGLVVAAVIIAGGIFFANSEETNGNGCEPTTMVTAQESGKHDTDNNDSITEANDNAETTSSDESEEKGATNDAKSESSVADENTMVQQSTKMSASVSEKSANNVDGDVETNARRVIRGDFGNGQVRKDRLGSSYSEIQGRVNEMYRQGLVR